MTMMQKTTVSNAQSGFTLIEVMMALVVVSVALTALSQGLGNYVFQQSGLQERVVATWAAQNRLLEIQNDQSGRLEKRAKETLLGNEWETEFKTEKTLIPGLNKIEISVALKGDKDTAARIYSVVGN